MPSDWRNQLAEFLADCAARRITSSSKATGGGSKREPWSWPQKTERCRPPPSHRQREYPPHLRRRISSGPAYPPMVDPFDDELWLPGPRPFRSTSLPAPSAFDDVDVYRPTTGVDLDALCTSRPEIPPRPKVASVTEAEGLWACTTMRSAAGFTTRTLLTRTAVTLPRRLAAKHAVLDHAVYEDGSMYVAMSGGPENREL